MQICLNWGQILIQNDFGEYVCFLVSSTTLGFISVSTTMFEMTIATFVPFKKQSKFKCEFVLYYQQMFMQHFLICSPFNEFVCFLLLSTSLFSTSVSTTMFHLRILASVMVRCISNIFKVRFFANPLLNFSNELLNYMQLNDST